MLPALLIALTVLASGLAALAWWRGEQREALRDRLLHGLVAPEAEAEVDLSAGDYGLTGRRRFAYHLARLLGTVPGRGLIVGVGAAIGFGVSLATTGDAMRAAGIGAASGILALLAVMLLLRARRLGFERAVRYELPNALELLAAIMEGGLAFEAALAHVLRESDRDHPLYFDLDVVSEAMRRGRRRGEALRLWAQRCNIAAVADVSAALVQADQTGGPLGQVLHHHARALFRENEAEIQRRAERVPIRMIFPMIFTIFPALFVVTAMPSFLRVLRVLEEVMKGAGSVVGGR